MTAAVVARGCRCEIRVARVNSVRSSNVLLILLITLINVECEVAGFGVREVAEKNVKLFRRC